MEQRKITAAEVGELKQIIMDNVQNVGFKELASRPDRHYFQVLVNDDRGIPEPVGFATVYLGYKGQWGRIKNTLYYNVSGPRIPRKANTRYSTPERESKYPQKLAEFIKIGFAPMNKSQLLQRAFDTDDVLRDLRHAAREANSVVRGFIQDMSNEDWDAVFAQGVEEFNHQWSILRSAEADAEGAYENRLNELKKEYDV